MANPVHSTILNKALDNKDISIWNNWYKDNPLIRPDLRGINLYEADLRDAYLSRAYLTGSNLKDANLSKADLIRSVLLGVDLTRADLTGTDLIGTDLSYANLKGAVLKYATLTESDLSYSDLTGADLTEADLINCRLIQVDLSNADLAKANLKDTSIGWTIFANVNLSTVQNLSTTNVFGPCEIGINTLYRSQAIVHEPWFDQFLESCGIPETMRVFLSSLVTKAIDYYSCFISYSSKDKEFCEELQSRLKRHGLRVWFAPEEMKGGRKVHEQLYDAIRYHDKLILVLSEASMQSNWVELEIQRARKREIAEGRQVLFPIMLTEFKNLQSWKLITSDGEDLAEEIRQYFIPDFTKWKDHDTFTQLVDRLVNDLKKDG